jgi:3',5'-cyclic AMP phosphodiesterase CpdA
VTPTLIAQLSDPHLRLDNPVSHDALAKAVARVLALNPLPAAVLVTGDIADTGDRDEYELARELLAPLPMPVHLLAGNHDRFEARTRYVADAGGVRLVVCDTSIPGRPEGTLELDWLAERLAEDRDTPTIVAMHHPPLDIGITWLDQIGHTTDARAALAELLPANVKRVVAGHVHRTVTSTLGGCVVMTCTSTNVQAELDFLTTDEPLNSEPPSILVHALLESGDLVSHVQPI